MQRPPLGSATSWFAGLELEFEGVAGDDPPGTSHSMAARRADKADDPLEKFRSAGAQALSLHELRQALVLAEACDDSLVVELRRALRARQRQTG